MTNSNPLIARSAEDLLAMVPYVLEFHPEDSVVMLTFGEGQFHARVDLPDSWEDLDAFAGLLTEPVVRHGVGAVALVAYTDDAHRAEAVLRALHSAMTRLDVTVHGMLRVRGNVWWAVHPEVSGDHGAGTVFDASTHPFRAQSVLEGKVTHGSREELADTLVGSDPDAVDAVEEAVMAAMRAWATVQRVAEQSWLRRTVAQHVADGSHPSALDVGRLLVACCDPQIRNEAWRMMRREDAAGHVEFWRSVVRRTPLDYLATPASLLAGAAWLSGHGALAWCALDRAALAEPDHRMSQIVGGLLTRAVPPAEWEHRRSALVEALDDNA